MREISVFNHMTVDGFFAEPHGEMDWFMAIKERPLSCLCKIYTLREPRNALTP